MAIGTNGMVAGVMLLIRGIRPTKVVTEVRMMARKRVPQLVTKASSTGMPSRRRRLTKSTSTRLAFTTTPDRATMPNSEKNIISTPITQWPKMAPTAPKGITLMMTSGWT